MKTRQIHIDTTQFKKRRLLQGKSTRQLANEAGVTFRTVMKVENGESYFPPSVKRIAEALGFNMESLVIEIPDEQSAESHPSAST